jgi:hypothetical protein
MSLYLTITTVLVCIADLSNLLINSDKLIDQNTSYFNKLIQIVKERQLIFRILLFLVVVITLFIALNINVAH